MFTTWQAADLSALVSISQAPFRVQGHFGNRVIPAPGGCDTPRHQEEQKKFYHWPRLSNFRGPDPEHIHTGVGGEASNPENPPYAAAASGTRALPGNNAPALHCEGSWQDSRRPCQASRGFRLYAS